MGSFASEVCECGADWDYTCILTPTGAQTLFNILLSDNVFGGDFELKQTNATPTTRAFLSSTSLKETIEILLQTKKLCIEEEPFKEERFLWMVLKCLTHSAAAVFRPFHFLRYVALS